MNSPLIEETRKKLDIYYSGQSNFPLDKGLDEILADFAYKVAEQSMNVPDINHEVQDIRSAERFFLANAKALLGIKE